MTLFHLLWQWQKKAAINEPQAKKEVLCSPSTRTTLEMEGTTDIDNVHLDNLKLYKL